MTHIWALRAAAGAAGPVDLEVTMPRRPITCRMNLRHRWRTYSTGDGSRYQRCARCGKDDDSIPSRPNAWFHGTG
jgi:hypothetical protein